jgi:hypothetical protein
MNILHLDSGREMRGGQWQVLALHRGLVHQGYGSLLLARPEAPLFSAAKSEALPVAEWGKLSLLAESPRMDVVHAHDARSHSIAALFAKHPLVVSRRVAFPVRKSPLSRWKYGRPALFLAVSKLVAAELHRAGIRENRIRVVYDGVRVPESAAQGDDVITLYTTDPAKGMALAAEAARGAGIELKISTDLIRDLPHARAMLYLTQSEGLGSGILLAMAHGVSVIASNVGGIPELIDNGVHGILVNNEAGEIVDGLGRLTPSMGRAARERVRQQFTEERMIEQTLAAYAEVTGKR